MKRIGLALLVVYTLLLLATPGASAQDGQPGLPGRPRRRPGDRFKACQEWRNSPPG